MTYLNLAYNQIGDEGAKRLSTLSNLTRLDLLKNGIGEEGARALTALRDLSELGLMRNDIGDEGAKRLASLQGLRTLLISHNQLGNVGAEALASLRGLTTLNLYDNDIGDRGAKALASIQGLHTLSLGENNIGHAGAQSLASLQELTTLRLNHNRIGDEGAQALASLGKLQDLSLSSNGIGDRGVEALTSLRELTSLRLGSNEIGDRGAKSLSSLQGLVTLHLSRNKIGDEGAKFLVTLQNLDSLTLSSNEIGDDGAAILLRGWGVDSRRRRRQLDLSDNNLSIIPPEVLEDSWDVEGILAAFERFQNSTTTPLDEAKLLVVGEEAVGKTSLVRYLIDNQPCNPSENKTPGIDTDEQIETEQWAPENTNCRLNIWDFGGQEVMRGTHKFFLTKRSLYLLVLSDRLEDCEERAHEWLQIIRSRGGESPVLIVINKCDDGEPLNLHLNETKLRREFPAIVGPVLRTSCASGAYARASIDRLRQEIVSTLDTDVRLAHVRDRIPVSWQSVKQAISARARNESVLESSDFKALCITESITKPAEQRILLSLLHDLGTVVAHGIRDDAPAALREITLLDPNWLTKAIYDLLNHDTLKGQRGEFTRAQLCELLDAEHYPRRWHEFILDMMMNDEIGLCFEVLGSKGDRFLLPALLDTNEPDGAADWPQEVLRFRYCYDLLPRRFIPRFIVTAHRKLTESSMRWATGVELEVSDCPVLVTADRERKLVDIQVAGPSKRRRGALAVVLDDLARVHAANREIQPSPRVPFPDEPDKDIRYEALLMLENRRGSDYLHFSEEVLRDYRVGDLLDGVGRDLDRRQASARAKPERKPRTPPVRAPREVVMVEEPDETPTMTPTASSFRWLHLTDLHFGLEDQDWLWPQSRVELFEDLAKIHDTAGPWDVVFFTGDLTQAGKEEEFKALDTMLGELWAHLQKLGRAPKALLPVPGNHDLKYQSKLTTSTQMLLSKFADFPDLPKSFWANEDSGAQCRGLVTKLFAAYTAWWDARRVKLPSEWGYHAGLLPGEYSLSIPCGEHKLGVVGLNTSFLHFTGGVGEDSLELHPKQFQAACDGDGPRWAKGNNLNFLLTHHPPSWLRSEARKRLKENIMPSFAAHLHGHMHVPRQTTTSRGAGTARRWFQGPSLFGLEKIKGRNEVERIHGYTAGQLEFAGDQARLRYWPRDAQLTQSGERKLGPDRDFTLENDNGTKNELIQLEVEL